ncbi:MAG TPA: glycerophosphodiester phosphodiesterase family protein [Roseiarcus sp.]
MTAAAFGWLTARPIAHRGLHDAAQGRVENTLGAAQAAIAGGFAIECDVRLSSDGEAVVFHDATLDRLMRASGALGARTAGELRGLRFKATSERIPTLPELLADLAGKVPLICEIKSRFDGDMRLAARVATLAAEYAGPLALKSFDPEAIAQLRASGLANPLGIVAEASYEGDHWRELRADQKQDCAAFLHYPRTRPDFLSWHVDDLPHPTPALLRALAALPVMVWTVRTAEQKRRARLWADQIVFEETAGDASFDP